MGLDFKNVNCYKSGIGCLDPSQSELDDLRYKKAIAQAVQIALNRVSKSCSCSNGVKEYSSEFARIDPSKINTSTWISVYSLHGSASESSIPDSPYVIKIYNDPRRGDIGAVTTPTSSLYHTFQALEYLAGFPVNGWNAESFLSEKGAGDAGCQ